MNNTSSLKKKGDSDSVKGCQDAGHRESKSQKRERSQCKKNSPAWTADNITVAHLETIVEDHKALVGQIKAVSFSGFGIHVKRADQCVLKRISRFQGLDDPNQRSRFIELHPGPVAFAGDCENGDGVGGLLYKEEFIGSQQLAFLKTYGPNLLEFVPIG